MIRKLLLILLILTSLSSLADLRPPDLSMNLSSSREIYSRNEVIQLQVSFTNHTSTQKGIILPGTKNKGKRILYLSYYSVDSTNFYTNVHTESRVIEMDTSKPGYTGWANLDSGASTSIPIFINDNRNYRNHNVAYHKLPDLPAGTYQVLVWYEPWAEPMAEYAFEQLDPFGHSEDDFRSDRIYLPQAIHSNYLTLTISDTATPPQWIPTKACPANCAICSAIDKNKWNTLRQLISKQTDYSSKIGRSNTDNNWLEPHRNIPWVSPPPEAILASLPTYTYRSMIFKNDKGYYYYSATWQLGRVFPVRSRISTWVQQIIRIAPPTIRDEQNYRELTHFTAH